MKALSRNIFIILLSMIMEAIPARIADKIPGVQYWGCPGNDTDDYNYCQHITFFKRLTISYLCNREAPNICACCGERTTRGLYCQDCMDTHHFEVVEKNGRIYHNMKPGI